MQRRQLLFPLLIKSVLIFLGRSTVLLLKLTYLIFTGFRRLKVERVLVNNAFLLANGLIVIHWKVKNALWIRVQGRWTGSRKSGTLIIKAEGMTMASIRIQGFLSSYRREFEVHPVASVVVETPRLLPNNVSLLPDVFYPALSPVLSQFHCVCGWNFKPYLARMEFAIPTFQIDNQYEKRLLQ